MVLEFSDVRFSRGQRRILDGLSWCVDSGTTVILGPNGAGKTTLINLAASVLTPAAGSITLGERAQRRHLSWWRAQVGWVPQRVAFVPGFTVQQQLAYAGWLAGLSRRAARTSADQSMERGGLTEFASRRCDQLSGGEQRRVAIAAALVHEPALLLLDEPTVGLDPEQRARFRETLRDAASRASSVLLSTHQTDDLDIASDHVAVMRRGHIVWHGPTRQFLRLGGTGGGTQARAERAYQHVVTGDAQ